MQIQMRFEIPCPPDAAWDALHDPQTLPRLTRPFLTVEPVGRMPARWRSGDEATVQLRTAGVPAGRQLIRISDHTADLDGIRVQLMRDSGRPLTGILAALTRWDHQMAVSAIPGEPGRTLWRDRLVIGGAIAPFLWPVMWMVWQWRRIQITRFARTWS